MEIPKKVRGFTFIQTYDPTSSPPYVSSGEYGYIGGGYNDSSYTSTVERFQFPFASGTAELAGNLVEIAGGGAGFSSSRAGYITSGGMGSSVNKIDFPFDSATAVSIGNTPNSANNDPASFNSSQHGYSSGATAGAVESAAIYRVDFSNEFAGLVYTGLLTTVRRYINGGFNSSQHGYTCGGMVVSGSITFSTIDRITFPHDSGVATHTGNLSETRAVCGGCNSSTHGFIIGGSSDGGTTRQSTIERVAFPFSSGTADHVGNLNKTGVIATGFNSTIHGFAHCRSGSTISTINRIVFPFDSGTSEDVGNLTEAKYYTVAIDNTDFVSQFI